MTANIPAVYGPQNEQIVSQNFGVKETYAGEFNCEASVTCLRVVSRVVNVSSVPLGDMDPRLTLRYH